MFWKQSNLHGKSQQGPPIDLLQGINEFSVVDGWSVDDLLDELPVTVGVGCGDVEQDLQVLHGVCQCHHLLGCKDVQLESISIKRTIYKTLWTESPKINKSPWPSFPFFRNLSGYVQVQRGFKIHSFLVKDNEMEDPKPRPGIRTYLRGSLKRTVAAQWKTMLMCSARVAWSSLLRFISFCVRSLLTATIFSAKSGCSSRTWSNSWQHKPHAVKGRDGDTVSVPFWELPLPQ